MFETTLIDGARFYGLFGNNVVSLSCAITQLKREQGDEEVLSKIIKMYFYDVAITVLGIEAETSAGLYGSPADKPSPGKGALLT